MRSAQDRFLGSRRDRQKRLKDKVKIKNEIKLLPADILSMKWLHDNISGSSPGELHNLGLFRKENQQIVRTDCVSTLSVCPCLYNLTVMVRIHAF